MRLCFRCASPGLLGLLLISTACFAGAERFSAKVVAVAQGDLITVSHEGEEKEIRLYGADCPELEQAYGKEARDFVKALLLDKEVQVEVKTLDSQEKVAIVSLPDKRKLNNLLVEQGHAWWDTKNLPEDKVYKKLTAKAIVAEVGLWRDPTALSPWDYRKSHLMPDYSYGIKKAEAQAQEEEKVEAKVLSAKGNEVYRSNENMGTGAKAPSSRGAASTPMQTIEDEYKNVDPMDLIGRHAPRIAKDAQGNPLGLTADEISALPGAGLVGLQDGDIIAGVNGQRITSEAQVFGMAEKFKNQKHFDVEVIRGGQTITIPVDLP